jgi:hypothetical protein
VWKDSLRSNLRWVLLLYFSKVLLGNLRSVALSCGV